MNYDDWKSTEPEIVSWRDMPLRGESDPFRLIEERAREAREILRQLDEEGRR